MEFTRIGNRFSIPSGELVKFLRKVDGFVFGGICTSLFCNRPILPEQDLDICVTEIKGDRREILQEFIVLFMNKHKYCLRRKIDVDPHEYGNTHFARKVSWILEFQNTEGGMKVQFILTHCERAEDFIEGIDLNCCQFWLRPGEAMKCLHDDDTVSQILAGRARVNPIPENMTHRQAEKLHLRLCKYKDMRGFDFPDEDVMRVRYFRMKFVFHKDPGQPSDVRSVLALKGYFGHAGLDVDKIVEFTEHYMFIVEKTVRFTFEMEINIARNTTTTRFVEATVI